MSIDILWCHVSLQWHFSLYFVSFYCLFLFSFEVSRELLEKFAEARTNNNVRWIKAIIEDESVNFVMSAPFGANIESDFAAFHQQLKVFLFSLLIFTHF
jgi:hypothetical protein